MTYEKCLGYEGYECPVVKTGTKQRNPRCYSCSKQGNTHGAGKLGKTYASLSPEHREKLSVANKGNILSLATRQAMSLGQGGDGDVLNRKYPGLRRWTRLVKESDGYKCIMCDHQGTKGDGIMEAHHVVPKALHPELATEVFNGVTLCKPCHKEIHR